MNGHPDPPRAFHVWQGAKISCNSHLPDNKAQRHSALMCRSVAVMQ